MKKIWEKKKAVIIYLTILLLSLLTLLGLGFAYSNSLITYEVVQVGKAVTTMNYTLGTGDKNQVTTPFVEGPVVTTTKFDNIWKMEHEIQEYDSSDENGNMLFHQEEITNNLKKILLSYTESDDTFVIDEDFFLIDSSVLIPFDDMLDSEKSLIILANSTINNKTTEWKENEELDKAARIIFHYRPLEIENEDGSVMVEYPTLAYGVVDHIISDEENDTFRFAINQDARWENNTPVTASDLIFPISHQIPAMYSSAAAYMLIDFSNIKGISYANDQDSSYTINDDEYYDRYDVDDYNSSSELGLRDTMINYGLMPESRTIFKRVDNFSNDVTTLSNEDENGKANGSIRYFDANRDGNDEYVEGEYSYIEFDLLEPSLVFPTMFTSQAYWPISIEWFYNTIGLPTQEKMIRFGNKENLFLSNSAFKVDKFDSIYGINYSKNENYYESDLVSIQKGAYRFASEASVKVAMFSNGSASQIDATGAAKILSDNQKASKWIKPKFSKPNTGYMNFNLGSDCSTNAAKYTKDPNFRRFIYHIFDTGKYHNAAGYSNTQPTSLYTAQGMYVNGETSMDFVDYAEDTTIVSGDKDALNDDYFKNQQLEYYGVDDRVMGLEDPDKNIGDDLNYNLEAANYYWNAFLDDMDQLGQDVSTITLKYLTIGSAVDPYNSTLNQGIDDFKNAGYLINSDGEDVEISISPVLATSSNFWSLYYGDDYDLSRAIWGPDYLDVWSFIGMFNSEDLNRNLNPTGSWSFWDGSDYTLNDNEFEIEADYTNNGYYTYGSKEMNDKARELFNDGVSQWFYDKENANITSIVVEDTENDISSVNDSLGEAVNRLWEAVLSDNDVTSDSSRKELIEGINHDAHTSEIWADEDIKIASWLILESILRDGAPVIVGYNETASVNPSRLVLETDPILGYQTRLFAIDITKIKKDNYWSPAEKTLRKFLEPN